MAVYKLFPTKDTTIYSYYPTMNTGLDAILETSNTINLEGNPISSRYLIEYDTTEIQNIINNKILGNNYNVYLKNSISTAQGINADVSLELFALAQSWNNGTGHYLDNPKVTDGASWESRTTSGSGVWNMSGSINGYGYTGSFNSNYTTQGGGSWFTSSGLIPTITESFGLRSKKDLELEVKSLVNLWYNGSIDNNGFLIKLSGSAEFNNSLNNQPVLKYYSVDTNTIYPPQLEFRWRDYSTITPPPSSIVSTQHIKLSLDDNPGEFQPSSINRFYVNVSPLYPTRTYQTSSLFTNTNYLPTSSYYAIKDLATNEFVINFDTQYTQISSDSRGNYFDVYMSGLEPERYYKVLIKTEINGSTLILDDDYYFKVISG